MSDPESRNEALLGDILGESNEFGEPQSANEAILQNMLGANNVIREPQSRIESMLKEILDGGGMGCEMNVVIKNKYAKTLTATYTFSKPGTFYVSIVGYMANGTSTTGLSRVAFTATNGEAVTPTLLTPNGTSVYGYKLKVAESEDPQEMVFSLATSTKEYSVYGAAYCWYPASFETAPVTIT